MVPFSFSVVLALPPNKEIRCLSEPLLSSLQRPRRETIYWRKQVDKTVKSYHHNKNRHGRLV